LFTLNGEHLISQSLALCGGINVFADESVLAPQIGKESVVLSNPEVMFASVINGEANPLQMWLEWNNLQAVKEQRLYLLPADEITRASPRMLAAVVRACSLMHQNKPSG
jgi:iron complex transport system substrate-binding protein